MCYRTTKSEFTDLSLMIHNKKNEEDETLLRPPVRPPISEPQMQPAHIASMREAWSKALGSSKNVKRRT